MNAVTMDNMLSKDQLAVLGADADGETQQMPMPASFAGLSGAAGLTTAKQVRVPETGQKWVQSEVYLTHTTTLEDLVAHTKSTGSPHVDLMIPKDSTAFWGMTPAQMAALPTDGPTHLVGLVLVDETTNNMGVDVGVTLPTLASTSKNVSMYNKQEYTVVAPIGTSNNHTLAMKALSNPDRMDFFKYFKGYTASNLEHNVQDVLNRPDVQRVPADHPVVMVHDSDCAKGLDVAGREVGDSDTFLMDKAYVGATIKRIRDSMDKKLNQVNANNFVVRLHPTEAVADGGTPAWNTAAMRKVRAMESVANSLTTNIEDAFAAARPADHSVSKWNGMDDRAKFAAMDAESRSDIDLLKKKVRKLSADLVMTAAEASKEPLNFKIKVKVLSRPIGGLPDDDEEDDPSAYDAVSAGGVGAPMPGGVNATSLANNQKMIEAIDTLKAAFSAMDTNVA